MTQRDHERRAPDVEFDFGHDDGAPSRARTALAALIGDTADPISKSVEAVTSEMVSNVVQHTSGGGTVRAWDPKPDKPFHIEVSDSSMDALRVKRPDDDGGRGLHIVASLADDWGVTVSARGKTVWADFIRPETEQTVVGWRPR